MATMEQEKTRSVKFTNGEHIELVFQGKGNLKNLDHKTSPKGFGPIVNAEVHVFVDGEEFSVDGKNVVILTHSSPACVWYMDPVTRTWKVRCS